MIKQTLLAGLLALAGAAQAQDNCPCNGGVGTLLSDTTNPSLGAALAGKMLCAAAGNERWQQWHNGSTSSGDVWDFKRGPGHPVDPSSKVGTYQVKPVLPRVTVKRVVASDAAVTYSYGGNNNYSYHVCRVGTTSYAFCGALHGGRDITNVIVGGNGTMASCDTVVNDANVRVKPQVKNLLPPR